MCAYAITKSQNKDVMLSTYAWNWSNENEKRETKNRHTQKKRANAHTQIIVRGHFADDRWELPIFSVIEELPLPCRLKKKQTNKYPTKSCLVGSGNSGNLPTVIGKMSIRNYLCAHSPAETETANKQNNNNSNNNGMNEEEKKNRDNIWIQKSIYIGDHFHRFSVVCFIGWAFDLSHWFTHCVHTAIT